jgi:pimeloyl-ACP methyl ester carboxylesterase
MTENPRVNRKLLISMLLVISAPVVLLALTRVSAEVAGRVLEKRYPPPGRMIPVGDYKLQLYCTGTGSPTILIEPGMGLDWVGWRFVIPQLTPLHRVCVYDRAGYGWSDAGPEPRTAFREASELHSLLETGRVPKPYVLAAHSFGGYIARIYASRFRESLAGVVLVEPSHEDEPTFEQPPTRQRACALCGILQLVPPLGIQHLKRMYNGYNSLPRELRAAELCYQNRFLVASSIEQLKLERNEFDSLRFTKAEIRQTVFPRDLPLTVITALNLAASPPQAAVSIHRELQLRLAQSSNYGKQIVVPDSSHMIPLDKPAVIVDALREMTERSH